VYNYGLTTGGRQGTEQGTGRRETNWPRIYTDEDGSEEGKGKSKSFTAEYAEDAEKTAKGKKAKGKREQGNRQGTELATDLHG